MESWKLLMYALIILPVLYGIGAYFVKRDGIRDAIVWIASLTVIAGGILLVWQSLQVDGKILIVEGGEEYSWIGFGLELAILLVILAVSIKIRSVMIIIFSVIQVAFAVGERFLPSAGETTIRYFYVDNLARIMLLVTAIVGGIILIFSIGYMREHAKHAPRTAGSMGRFFFFFISFLGFMVGLVLSSNLTLFSFFWEATTLCSYALIGQDGGEARRVNAVRALRINSFGGVLLLAGIFILRWKGCGDDFGGLSAATIFPALLMCIAAFTKSAQFPFQSWLLGAMVAPTPVSAMLHAATMVKAGVYLVMRIAPIYFLEKDFMMAIAFMGAVSFLGAAFLACTQSNGKKVLAYSTISNLGLVVACAGIESPLAYAAGLSIITFHALSKGLLFLCVGRIEQKIGSRDIEDMDAMPFKMHYTTVISVIGMMSMLLPPFGMLLSKWLAIEATIRSPFLLVCMVLGSALTVYFWAKWIGRMHLSGHHDKIPKEQMPATMRLALTLLAVLIVVTGFVMMFIFNRIFTPMTKTVLSGDNAQWSVISDASRFPAWLIFAFIIFGLLLYLAIGGHRLTSKNVHLPYLCGENVKREELETSTGIKSYDFYSLCGNLEHARFSGYYFTSIIKEGTVTNWLNWISWLIIVVMIGLAIMATN